MLLSNSPSPSPVPVFFIVYFCYDVVIYIYICYIIVETTVCCLKYHTYASLVTILNPGQKQGFLFVCLFFLFVFPLFFLFSSRDRIEGLVHEHFIAHRTISRSIQFFLIEA